MRKRYESTEDLDALLRQTAGETFVVPEDLAARTARRLAPHLRSLRARRKEVLGKLAVVAALSFPVLVAANAAVAWLLHEALVRFVPEPVALATTGLVGAVMLLLLSLSYGSLPILASFGLRPSEETT